jgi:excisionase family DNA binding protein
VSSEDNRLLTADEVADLLHVDVSWVRSATRDGVIPTVPLGRWRRYRRSSVLEWLERLEQPGRPVRLRSVAPKTAGDVTA